MNQVIIIAFLCGVLVGFLFTADYYADYYQRKGGKGEGNAD